MMRPDRRRRAGEAGFTIVELLVYLLISVVVIGSAYQLLIGQNRLYLRQWELQDVRSSLRLAGGILAYELRQASAFGDPYTITPDSFTIRSLQGTGIVCARHGTLSRVGLWGTTGKFYATAADSALIFATADWGTGDDQWVPARIVQIWESPTAGGVSWCDWGDGSSTAPDLVVEVRGTATPPDNAEGEIAITALGDVYPGATVQFAVSHPALSCSEFDSRAGLVIDADTWSFDGTMSGCTFTVPIPVDAGEFQIQIDIEGDDYPQLEDDIEADYEWEFDGGGSAQDSVVDHVNVGAPFRAFRHIQYGIYEEEGRWWLGRKLGSASAYEKLIGPLQPPTDDGLKLLFYDAAGNITADPTRVEMVDIHMRAESFGKVRRANGQTPAYEQDSLTIRVTLRG